MATYLTPTASQTVPLRLSLSPDGEYLAIALRNNVAEVCCTNNVCIFAYNTYPPRSSGSWRGLGALLLSTTNDCYTDGIFNTIRFAPCRGTP